MVVVDVAVVVGGGIAVDVFVVNVVGGGVCDCCFCCCGVGVVAVVDVAC